ncbi:MAG: Mut7-C RNAse domain-containing protein [candidate division WOR-3 bacterium]|nr:Mut7-C RNAse domain-containing protein [candidate division WOR-3 bacterium]
MAKKFICNGMLGKLSRLLRIIGVDSTYTNEGMAILLLARKESRVIITRNTRLRGRNGVFFLDKTVPEEQLSAVVDAYNLWSEIRPFSRCVICNDELIPIEKDAVKGRVPFFTYKHFDEYAKCPRCERIYWKGSHYKNMLKEVDTVLMRD